MDDRQIIIRPVVSEKSYSLSDAGVYQFVVGSKASKTQIRKAVEAIWQVRVDKVNTAMRKGKRKRHKTVLGRRSTTKHAFVKVAAGEKIELFEAR